MLTGINHVTLPTANLPQAIAFYCELLSFRLRARWRRGAYLSVPGIWLCLECGAPPVKLGGGHIAFDISAERFPILRARLLSANVPQWRQNSSEGDSLYFCDPDGHRLELHVGSLQTRLAACRQSPYDDMELFE